MALANSYWGLLHYKLHHIGLRNTARVAYLSVGKAPARGHVDWEWLDAQPDREGDVAQPFVRQFRLEKSLVVRVDGTTHKGQILRPE